MFFAAANAVRRLRVPRRGYGRSVTEPRTFGVEEELLLCDTASGALRPLSGEIVRALSAPGPGDPDIKHEFFLEQVEVATHPCATAAELRAQLGRGRELVAAAGHRSGVVPMAVPVPVQLGATATPTPGERYAMVRETYGRIAQDSLFCALQVHVQVDDDEEAVAVMDRLRPWVPLLLAISANSPYWRGRDSGFASWRSQLWERWPSSGPREPFGSAAGYRTAVAQVIGSGAAVDEALVNFDVRRSVRFPTVELRIADVCTDIEDAVAIACLTRGLVSAVATQWHQGAPTPRWTVDRLRAARDLAARHGLSGTLAHPVTGRLEAASRALTSAIRVASPALENSGDADLVRSAAGRWVRHGTGAVRQRAAGVRGLAAVVDDLVTRTCALPLG